MPRMPPYIWAVREKVTMSHRVATVEIESVSDTRSRGQMSTHHVNVHISNHEATMVCSKLFHFCLFLGNQFCQSLLETIVTM